MKEDRLMNEIRIPYKPNKIIFIVIITFFAICAYLIGNIASTNDSGIIINRIFEFSIQNTTIFYWIMSGASSLFVVTGVFVLIKSIVSDREIVISETSITSPKSGFSKLDIMVNFSDITNITIQTIQKTKILNIEHTNGKLSIPNNMLPSNQVFEELFLKLNSKIND